MEIILLALGLSFLLLWIFKQPRRTTKVIYPAVGLLCIGAYLLSIFLVNKTGLQYVNVRSLETVRHSPVTDPSSMVKPRS